MDFPEKLIRTYGADPPKKIIKGAGEPPSVKVVEYILAESDGNNYIYNRVDYD